MLAPLEVALERLFEHFGKFIGRACFVCVALCRFQLLDRPMKGLELLHFLAAHRMGERTSSDPMTAVLAPNATPTPPRTHSPVHVEGGRKVRCRRLERFLSRTELVVMLIA